MTASSDPSATTNCSSGSTETSVPPVAVPNVAAPPVDHTKTKFYARIDLITKLISSLGLVLLGVAGASIQWHIARANELAQESERQSQRAQHQKRKYIPMFRSLAELEIYIGKLQRELALARIKNIALDPELYTQSDELKYVAGSLFLPDGDPNITVAFRERPPIRNPQEIVVPLRAMLYLISDLMKLRSSQFLNDDHPLEVALERPALVESVLDTRILHPLSPEAIPAWRAWLGSHRKVDIFVIRYAPLEYMLQDVRNGLIRTGHHILTANPELGDQYVTIRADTLRTEVSSVLK